MSFWGELKRRNVYKVGVAYAIVAWLLIQFAAIAFPHLNFPSWAVPFVIIILIIGFPIALLLAWAYEVTPDGIKRTKEVPLSESITHLTGKKLNYILAVLLIIAVGYIVILKFFAGGGPVETELTPIVTKQSTTTIDVEELLKTIAVLPFDDLSPEKDQEYFVLGLSEEILNSLAQIEDLTVIAKTSSFSFKGTNKTIQEIASVLAVENILEGSVRKVGNALRITAQLVKAVDGSHIWSKTYDRELTDIFAVQEDIATAVADELKASLGIGKSFKQLGGTDNVEAYELYLVGQGQINRQEYSLALKSIDAAIALDSRFALAWAMKAINYENLSISGPTNRAIVEVDAGLSAAQRAIEIEPNLAEAYAVLGSIKSAAGDWIDAELAFRKALELATESSLVVVSYSLHLFAVGYLERAHELLKENLIRDPLNGGYRFLYITSFGFRGDRQQAEKENEKCRALFGDDWDADYIVQVRLGLGDFVSKDDIQEVFELGLHRNLEIDMQSPEKGIAELRRFYADNNDLPAAFLCFVTLIAANLGDNEFAMDVMEKMTTSNPKSVFWIWLPVMHEARQTPRFKNLVKKIGLVDYWNKFGWPDMCHKLDNGDFECD